MIEFGKTLRAAREAKGMSIAHVAEATHMLARTIESLENEDFSDIPAAIYGRGFVKLYCELVGLDAKPIIAEFMEIYNGERDIGIKERPVAPVIAPPAPESVPAVPVAPPPVAPPPSPSPVEPPQFDLFSRPSEDGEASAKAPERPAKTTAFAGESKYSRYASPINDRYDSPSFFKMPSPAVWRTAVLIVAAIAVMWVLVAGVRALYRATTPEEVPMSGTTAAALSESAQSAPAAGDEVSSPETKAENEKREPVKIPALYIDVSS